MNFFHLCQSGEHKILHSEPQLEGSNQQQMGIANQALT